MKKKRLVFGHTWKYWFWKLADDLAAQDAQRRIYRKRKRRLF